MDGRVNAKQIQAWLLVTVWAVIVWGLGSDDLSAAETSSFLRPWLEWLYPDLTVLQLYRILVWIRKAAHVVEYALLGILTLRALLLGKRPSAVTCALLALAFIVTFATADETRQSLSMARTGSAWDVALDATGGAIAIILLLYLRFGKLRRVATESAPEDADASSGGTT
jgi:VanZ family protein